MTLNNLRVKLSPWSIGECGKSLIANREERYLFNDCFAYATKQYDGEAVALDYWGLWDTIIC